MIERTVERHLTRRVKETGGEVRKVVWPGRNGAPDRLVGWPDVFDDDRDSYISVAHHAFVELKRPKKGAEAHQLREHERLRAIGFEVVVLDTIEAVDAFIDGVVA